MYNSYKKVRFRASVLRLGFAVDSISDYPEVEVYVTLSNMWYEPHSYKTCAHQGLNSRYIRHCLTFLKAAAMPDTSDDVMHILCTNPGHLQVS